MTEDKSKMTFMGKWLTSLETDSYIDLSEEEIAFIVLATVRYGLRDEKTNFEEKYGKEFKMLNMAMPNIYNQIDSIKHYDPTGKKISEKYDSEQIKELRLQGMSAKQICAELGYDINSSKSLTSNKGWKEAGEITKKKQELQEENLSNVFRF